ncbi:MAG: hypothetical protein AB7T10_04115 [bacterium]
MIDNIIESIKNAEEKAKNIISDAKIEAHEIISKASIESKQISKSALEQKTKMFKEAQVAGEAEAMKIYETQKSEDEKYIKSLETLAKKNSQSAVSVIIKEILK